MNRTPGGRYFIIQHIQYYNEHIIKMYHRDTSGFLPALKERVDRYLKKNKFPGMPTRYGLQTVSVIINSSILCGSSSPPLYPYYYTLAFAILIGMTMAFVGFNICHDALHGAYSSNKKVNRRLVSSFISSALIPMFGTSRTMSCNHSYTPYHRPWRRYWDRTGANQGTRHRQA